ncbi:putative toxin-antitoxin system toxin component, PIN family [Thermococcus sp.]|uniref:putative toxin-antitoxin system toxin component, PIN family n=1 Tax=Thermococcus sp. TaxID=35749 RepID=UPI0025EAC66E|nr:putative toxin-antitoxin system toxin component, PIN family [Thermococcus sp.]
MRVVLDTNVVLGALIKPNGLASLLVRALDRKRLVNYTSEEALTELSLKVALLQEVGKLSHEWKKTLAHFIATSEVVSPLQQFNLCREEDDNKWLEIAYEARANFILTRDGDLLDIRGDDRMVTLERHILKS